MKTSFILIITFFLTTGVNAQTDTLHRLPDTLRTTNLPDQGSWYNSELPKDVAPFKDSILLKGDDVPRKLKKALDAKDEFLDWRKGDLYFDRVNKFYKLFVLRGKNVDRYVLTEDAKIISFQSYIVR